MSVCRFEYRVKSKDADMHMRLRMSALFTLLQEISIRHTEELGAGREKTLDKGLLWVVTLQRAEIARMPEYDEDIVIESWPGETMHVLFPRYYRVLDAEGHTAVSASAIWALVSRETRSFVFPERYGISLPAEVTGNEIALPSAIAAAPEAESARDFTVPYSYVDLNGHMNNARYFDLAEDCIPAPAEGRRLKAVRSEFSGEARLGDSFTVSVARHDNAYYISGENVRRLFRLSLEYEM